MITFKYRNETSPRGRILRPVADVEIQSVGGAWIECHPYIDSGADVTLIPFSMGKLLGLKMSLLHESPRFVLSDAIAGF
jgi:hypothetical protein